MRWNLVGAFIRNDPFGTEIAFRKGLERIGETVTVVDPSYPDQRFDESPDVTVVFKWMEDDHYRATLARIPGKKIIYQVDDLRFDHIKKMMLEMRRFCQYAFTFDSDGARLAKEYGYDDAMRLLLTADNELYKPTVVLEKDIDVCFVGSMSYGENHKSRMKMIRILQSIPGLKVAWFNELFDIPRICEIYSRSKIVLNHATDVGQRFGHGFGYQCRHFEAGFTKSCLLSNVVVNDQTIGSFATFDSEQGLVDMVQYLLSPNNWQVRHLLAEGLFEELNASHRPEHRAQEMLEFVKRLP